MKIAICDDEREICEGLERLIRKQRAEAEVVLFSSGGQLLESRERFQIVLMDIQMEGMSGIETARALRMKDETAVLIFVTALREYGAESVYYIACEHQRNSKAGIFYGIALKGIYGFRIDFVENRTHHAGLYPARHVG